MQEDQNEKMHTGAKQFSINVMARPTTFFVIWGWPALLVLTWILLLLLSHQNGVLREIPEELRKEITGMVPEDVPGFLQDPFYTVFQFFWLPFVWLSVRSFSLVPTIIGQLWERRAISHDRTKDESELRILIEKVFNELSLRASRIWPWILAILVGVVSMSWQVEIQVDRIQRMNIMYWWDWRISHRIYIVRLLMVGFDIALATVLLMKGIQVFTFVRKFLTQFKFVPRPFHPDKAGGLAPIGKLCLSFVFPALVVGVTLAISFIFHKEESYRMIHMVTMTIYIPIVTSMFFYPLQRIHLSMRNVREKWLDRISKEINQVLSNLDDLIEHQDTSPATALFSRLEDLKNYYKTVERVPVWPFNLDTFSKFISALLIPVVVIGLETIFEYIT